MANSLSVLCAFCGNHDLMAMEDDERHYVQCGTCLSCGPIADTPEVAMLSWCERHDNEPVSYLRASRLAVFNA